MTSVPIFGLYREGYTGKIRRKKSNEYFPRIWPLLIQLLTRNVIIDDAFYRIVVSCDLITIHECNRTVEECDLMGCDKCMYTHFSNSGSSLRCHIRGSKYFEEGLILDVDNLIEKLQQIIYQQSIEFSQICTSTIIP